MLRRLHEPGGPPAGDYAGALKEVKTVQGMDIPEVQKPNLVNLARRLENQEDINK